MTGTPARLAPGDEAGFAAAADLLAAAIDPRETKSRERLHAMLARPDYRFLVARRAGRVIAVSVVFVSEAPVVALVEYLAVAPGLRGQGLGARLFRASLDVARRGRADVPVLVEVDSDRAPGPDRELRRRRQGFYRRLGCARVGGCRYLLPQLGDRPAPPMALLAHRVDAAAPLARAELGAWLRAVYTEVYGCPASDPRIAAMLRGVRDPVRWT